ncbi:hypothetical protein ACFWB2_44315 [Streptomyces virginiae]|uniref:hypothetical protein n=1 Tax=Streptomyces virginiae TaxID=1961 RepID=UPI00367B989D
MIRDALAQPEPWDDQTTPTYLDERWTDPGSDTDTHHNLLVDPRSTMVDRAGGSPDITLIQPYSELETLVEPPGSPAACSFGPGVPEPWELRQDAIVTRRRHKRPGRSLMRRYRFAVLLLLLVAGFLVWRFWLAPPLEVQGTSVFGPVARLECGQTARIVATIRTNGAEGVIRYRWVRSDGTNSGVLRETLPRGMDLVQVRTSWSFSGVGEQDAWVALRFIDPQADVATTSLLYSCTEPRTSR